MSLLISCKVLCYLIFVISMYASGKCTNSTPPMTEATPLSSPTTKYRTSYVLSFSLNPQPFRPLYDFSVFNSNFSIIPATLSFPFFPLVCCNTFLVGAMNYISHVCSLFLSFIIDQSSLDCFPSPLTSSHFMAVSIDSVGPADCPGQGGADYNLSQFPCSV